MGDIGLTTLAYQGFPALETEIPRWCSVLPTCLLVLVFGLGGYFFLGSTSCTFLFLEVVSGPSLKVPSTLDLNPSATSSLRNEIMI